MEPLLSDAASAPPPAKASYGIGQRLLALDDVIAQLASHMRCESTIPSGLRSALHELLLRSEAARLAVLMPGPVSALSDYVEALSRAADQALLRARRSGRASRDLLQILSILSQGLRGMLQTRPAEPSAQAPLLVGASSDSSGRACR